MEFSLEMLGSYTILDMWFRQLPWWHQGLVIYPVAYAGGCLLGLTERAFR